ncbi:hypothetical protein ACE0DR_25485 [Azotobacter sp. CWF10]
MAFIGQDIIDTGMTKVADADLLTIWLRDHVAGESGGDFEPPTADRVERIARSALRAHEDRFYANVYGRLSAAARERLNALLYSDKADGDAAQDEAAGSAPAIKV